ncbi:MAG TPA: hypothetical protein VFT09_02165 [Ilumatobacteraceae bacterium]|nr:hypothetical protein [Ilumatobacteraceae bacterium]
MATTVFVVVVLLRFLVPLAIPRFPLPAILAALVLDAADQSIFQMFTDDPLPGYQTYDKALDVYYLAIAYTATMRNWRDPVAFRTSRFLYLYRLVGVTLFELLGWRWLLLVFPNTFEYFFIAYEFVRTRWNPARLGAVAIVGLAAFIWIVIKLPQEWWIHVAKLDFTDFMADHPWMWIVLGLAVVVAAVALYVERRRIPRPDWRFTVDVDRHLTVPPAPADPAPFWSAVLLEKVVLLALISVIFSQVLPDIRASNLGIAFGVALLTVANAAVSQVLRRRGRSWATTVGQFGAMLLVNVALVTVDALVGVRRGDRSPAGNTLFFVLLLSLLIALYDRFRATRDPEVDRQHVWPSFRAERAAHRQQPVTQPG